MMDTDRNPEWTVLGALQAAAIAFDELGMQTGLAIPRSFKETCLEYGYALVWEEADGGQTRVRKNRRA